MTATVSTGVSIKLADTTIFDVFDGFGSYIHDLEWSLQYSPESWAEYQKDPEPFLCDLVGDFAHLPAEIPDDKAAEFSKYLVRKWLCRPTSFLKIFEHRS